MLQKNVWKLSCIAVLGIALVLGAGGCSRPQESPDMGMSPDMVPPPDLAGASGTIRQIGSTTVLPLAEKWREEFNKIHPEVEIAISGGGSGTGIKELIEGNCEIANSSRDIKDSEIEQAKGAGIDIVEHVVAYDGIAVIVHPSNPINELSVEQISDMYTGNTTNWDAVGGSGEIQLINRDSASGTYESFKEMVVTLDGKDKDRDYAAHTLNQASNQAILQTVGSTAGAIGYIGLGYLDDTVKVLRIIPMGGGAAVEATPDNIMSGVYPIARALYCYTNGEPTGVLKELMDWIKGSDGQAIVTELGFVPIH